MRVGAVGFSSYQNFIVTGQGVSGADATGTAAPQGTTGIGADTSMQGVLGTQGVQGVKGVEDAKPTVNPGESEVKAPGRTSSPSECQTCKNRKYQDGSDEMVSFKSAAHISPQAAASRVRGHEQEHVSNAYKKAAQGNGKVVSATVSLKTAVCPECGRTYVAGGTTATQIKYPKEGKKNPYAQNRKAVLGDAVKGQNLDFAV